MKRINRHRARRASPQDGTQMVSDALVRRWILRMLVPLGGAHHFVHHEFYQDDQLAEFLELPTDDEMEDGEFDKGFAMQALPRIDMQLAVPLAANHCAPVRQPPTAGTAHAAPQV